MFFVKFKSNRPMTQVFTALVAIKIIAIGSLGASLAHADSPSPRLSPLPAYQQECASCHIAYPPGMLPAASWQRLMGGLSKHFGTDATLDAAQVRELGAWLQAHAGTNKRFSEAPAQDRISKSAWFVRKHSEVNSQIWTQPAVKGAANCAACHGTNGVSAGGAIKSLAGDDKDYFVAQMKAFKEGKRDATLMHQIAKGYSDAEIVALAGFFAAQKK